MSAGQTPRLPAAVAAGLGVTPRTPLGLPAEARPLRPEQVGLPVLPLALHTGAARPTAPVARLRAILDEALRAQVVKPSRARRQHD